MAWRNAFETMATEGTLKRLLSNLTYPKDTAGRPRVIVENTVAVVAYPGASSTFGTARPLYDVSAQFMVDERDHLRNAMRANYQRSTQRWTY